MTIHLKISIGQYSDKGVKALNQDFVGSTIPQATQLNLKGAVVALADGISTSDVSQIASEMAVKNFLSDYLCTSDTWSSKTSGIKVLCAINAWLFAYSQKSEYRFDKDKGYVCTLSAAVFKSRHAHIFHIGDSRIYRLRDNALEQLTKDHRVYKSAEEVYLSRALGADQSVEVDYTKVSLAEGDYFLLCSDGIYEYCDSQKLISLLNENNHDLDLAANKIAQYALSNDSDDNLSIQVVKIEGLPDANTSALKTEIEKLALPQLLHARQDFDGYHILREIHASSRSHVYLAQDKKDKTSVVIKIPSLALRNEPAYLESLLMEEWIARRVNNAHVMKAAIQDRERNYLYSVTEYIEGISLKQWLIDHPKPDIETVRNIIEQIAKGLQALHRLEILHQDLRPENIMIDQLGVVKIIDFGGASVNGLSEIQNPIERNDMQGTALYMAPEYFVGEGISSRSDQFSLAVITYHMLSGRFPYDTQVAKLNTISAQKRLIYHSVLDDEREIPAWVDHTLRTALQPFAHKRYEALSEFVYDLRHPNPKYMNKLRAPLIERNPLLFWKGLSLVLFVTCLVLLSKVSS